VLQSVGESCRVMQSVADGVVEHHGVLQCSVLQCSVLQCIVNCFSMLNRCGVLISVLMGPIYFGGTVTSKSMMQSVAECCRALQCVTFCYSV